MRADDLDITFYGHASLRLATGNVSVVTDPWFSQTGAFLGAWSQFPSVDDVDLEPIRNADYIVISHDHDDHFDLEFLRTVRPTATIMVPNYTDSRLRDTLARELPNAVRVVKDRVPVDLGDGLTMVPVMQPVPVWDDCAFVFQTETTTIVDLNDIKLPAEDLDWIASRFATDYLFLQFSGANWHPYVYEMDARAKRRVARQKVATKFRAVGEVVRKLDPSWVIPCAGPAVFLEDELFDANFGPDSIFPTQDTFVAYAQRHGFAERVAVPFPGDHIAGPDLAALTTRNLASPVFTDRLGYLRAYQARRRPVAAALLDRIPQPCGPLLDRCRDYFAPLIASSPYLAAAIGGVFVLECTGEHAERIAIDFGNPADPVRPYDGEHSFYRLRTEARFVDQVLRGNLGWEQLLLSMRVRAQRVPDVYNEHLVVFLRYANPEMFAAFEAYQGRGDDGDRFILRHRDRDLCVQRRCPHAGGDLSHGTVDGDELVCPVHGWAFSLNDGSCSRAGYSIAVEEIATTPDPLGSRS